MKSIEAYKLEWQEVEVMILWKKSNKKLAIQIICFVYYFVDIPTPYL